MFIKHLVIDRMIRNKSKNSAGRFTVDYMELCVWAGAT